MRLSILRKGHRPLQKLQLAMINQMMGIIPGPVATLSYRRNFFGKHYATWLHQSMRKAQHWTVAEVELFAAFVSKKNECEYCVNDHKAVVSFTMENHIIEAVLADYESAPIDARIKATLKFLEKLTLNPSQLSTDDLAPLKALDIPKKAIEEAIHVCAAFSIINRLADAFDFELSPYPRKAARFLLKNGYGAASLKG